MPGDAEFAIAFEYDVSPEQAAAFERVYRSHGDWARFFAGDPAYRGTELWALGAEPGRYLVIDRWQTAGAYRDFRERCAAEYERRSEQSASLYQAERIVGELRRAT